MADDLKKWLYLFNTGEDAQSYRRFGAHQVADKTWQFLVWAPHAKAVAVSGDFNDWQSSPLQKVGETGVWQGQLAAKFGDYYKFLITAASGAVLEKVDPYGFAFERKPGTAAKLHDLPKHDWQDQAWLKQRAAKLPYQRPVAIYEVHLGSFMRDAKGRYLSYAELAKKLLPYVKKMGYTHIELLPLTEHLLDASWGYQSFGYFAPTSRFGDPEGFLDFVDAAHRLNLGVIMDWVPGHFIKNTDTLALFDGTATFEYADPRRAENQQWGTWNFDLGKTQVQSYLTSSAMFWLDYCHLDGLRVDAVSSMIYLNYANDKADLRNQNGGQENLEGIAFLQHLNETVFAAHPDILMIAEESSAFPKVTQPTDAGGLGFNYKWNMGWMNDTLSFFQNAALQRLNAMQKLTFSFMYVHSEQYILPLSHDEVVHGKKSLMHKMPGDRYKQFANLRLLLAFQMTFPGKKLLFMGSEWGEFLEWREYESLDWKALADPLNAGMANYTKTLNKLYQSRPSLWQLDHEDQGLAVTIGDANDCLCYMRFGEKAGDVTIAVLNLQPVERQHFLVPVPKAGDYYILLNSEQKAFGGTWVKAQRLRHSLHQPLRGQPDCIDVILPALGALIITPKAGRK